MLTAYNQELRVENLAGHSGTSYEPSPGDRQEDHESKAKQDCRVGLCTQLANKSTNREKERTGIFDFVN